MQISNLPASNSFSSTDVLPIEINGVTYKVTGATLAAALQTLGNYLTPDNVANNLTTTAAGSVLDARQGKVLNDKTNAIQSDIAIIIEGNQTTHTGGVAIGEFVLVRNSTITGITDGLYKATQVIPVSTTITSAYLSAVDGGGLNELNSKMAYVSLLAPSSITTSVTSYNLTDDFTKYQMLFINLKYQEIYLNSISVPSSLFSSLTSSSACVQLQSGQTTIQVYKHTNTSVYMASSTATQNLRIEIIGFLAY